MTDPRACKMCPFLYPKFWLNMEEVLEWERLDRHLRLEGPLPKKSAPTYIRLDARHYFPPCDLERMGAA